jgi:hypothetical protein
MEKTGAITPNTPDPDRLAKGAKSDAERMKLLDTDLVKQAAAVVAAAKKSDNQK